MEERLTWEKLLSEKRQRMDNSKTANKDSRNEFEADYDRI